MERKFCQNSDWVHNDSDNGDDDYHNDDYDDDNDLYKAVNMVKKLQI